MKQLFDNSDLKFRFLSGLLPILSAFPINLIHLSHSNLLKIVPLFFLLVNCNNDFSSILKNINGYWEIKEVVLENGEIKEYQFNETIDYISITERSKGFRKKLKPNINGHYQTSSDNETIKLKIEDGNINLYYKTPYTNWKETITKATASELHIVNERGIVYKYKRYKPIELIIE